MRTTVSAYWVTYLGSSTLVGCHKVYCWNFFSNPVIFSAVGQRTPIKCIPKVRSQGNYNNWPRDLAHLSLNFYRVKKCEIWRRFPQHSSSRLWAVRVWKCSKISAADCSLLLKFYTEFGHLTPKVPQKFKVKGSKVKVTAWRNRDKNLPNYE